MGKGVEMTTVFIGDSVTDCDRLTIAPYGNGYVSKIAASGKLEGDIINMGTSGHRLVDLEARWESDVIAYKPSSLSVAIGINDTWRRYDDNDPTSVEDFEARYRRVLDRTIEACNPRIVLCEPFLLEVEEAMHTWREDLNPKIDVVHRLAKEYGAVLVRFDHEFATRVQNQPMQELAGDGIHPTDLGHQIMADLWLASVGA
jgi:lysophospholipase L1-like esterase